MYINLFQVSTFKLELAKTRRIMKNDVNRIVFNTSLET